MSQTPLWIPLAAAFFGAMIGGGFTLFGQWLQARRARETTLLELLEKEVSTILTLLEQAMGRCLVAGNKPQLAAVKAVVTRTGGWLHRLQHLQGLAIRATNVSEASRRHRTKDGTLLMTQRLSEIVQRLLHSMETISELDAEALTAEQLDALGPQLLKQAMLYHRAHTEILRWFIGTSGPSTPRN